MLSKFFYSQYANPLKGDWCLTIQNDLKILELNTFSFEDIQKLKKTEFKKIINIAVRRKAFSDLLKIKNTKNKIKHIQYEAFKMQDYLKPHSLTNDEVRHIFLSRSRMLFIRDNYSSQYKKSELYCQSCLDNNTRESQRHVFSCSSLSSGELTCDNICYDDLFKHDLEEIRKKN